MTEPAGAEQPAARVVYVVLRDPSYTRGGLLHAGDLDRWADLEVAGVGTCQHAATACRDCAGDWLVDYAISDPADHLGLTLTSQLVGLPADLIPMERSTP